MIPRYSKCPLSSPLNEHDAGPFRRTIFHSRSHKNCEEKPTLKIFIVTRWQMSHFGRPPLRVVGLTAIRQWVVFEECASFDRGSCLTVKHKDFISYLIVNKTKNIHGLLTKGAEIALHKT